MESMALVRSNKKRLDIVIEGGPEKDRLSFNSMVVNLI